MAKQSPLTDINGEVRELTQGDLKAFKPAAEVLPKELLAVLPKRGRPPGSGSKKSTTVRLDNEVLDAFKATGRGWQTRMNNALREWLKGHQP